jgi:hypothetical protein
MCIDRIAPPKRSDERMALLRASQWQSGDIIWATFLDGEPCVQESVTAVALTWLNYANLNLQFVDGADDADIRISFQEPGSWSFIGTECRTISVTQPTMNFGWLTRDSAADEINRVVLHEFGHALGCIHEHQNPAGGIKWNKEVAYDYYAGSPNFWSQELVDHNVFEVYDEDLTVHTRLDPASIMMYRIDPGLTLDGFEVGLNTELSSADKDFIRETYP